MTDKMETLLCYNTSGPAPRRYGSSKSVGEAKVAVHNAGRKVLNFQQTASAEGNELFSNLPVIVISLMHGARPLNSWYVGRTSLRIWLSRALVGSAKRFLGTSSDFTEHDQATDQLRSTHLSVRHAPWDNLTTLNVFVEFGLVDVVACP